MTDLEKQRDALLPEENQALETDRELYLECMNNKPLSERKTEQEIRDGLILYHHVYRQIRPKNL